MNSFAARSTPNFFRCRNPNLSAIMRDGKFLGGCKSLYSSKGKLHVLGCRLLKYIVNSSLPGTPKTRTTICLQFLGTAHGRYIDTGFIHISKQTQRCFSGNCDEKENGDRKTSPSTNTGEDEGGKLKDIERQEMAQAGGEVPSQSRQSQSSQESVQGWTSQETQQVPDIQEQVDLCQEAEQGVPKAESSDNGKRKAEQRIHSLKIKFKKKLAKRLITWDKIDDTFEAFPYFLSEHTKDLLIESAAARLWHYNRLKFGGCLPTSSHLLLITGPPGTEIYQEKLVRALARYLRTSLLILDSDILALQHCKEEVQSAESDSGEEDLNKTGATETWTIGAVDGTDEEDDEDHANGKSAPQPETIVEALERFVELHETSSGSKTTKHVSKADRQHVKQDSVHDIVKIGDHVKYIGSKETKSGRKRSNPRIGKQGLVTSVSEEFPHWIGVKFETDNSKGGTSSKKNNSSVVLCDVKELEKTSMNWSEREPWMIPIEVISELVASSGGVITYFPDIQKWIASSVVSDERSLFIHTLEDLLGRLICPAVFITGRIKESSNTSGGSWNPMRTLLSTLKTSSFKRTRIHVKGEKQEDLKGTEEVFNMFKNIIPILPPQKQDLLQQWREQLDQDKKEIILRNNSKQIQKVLSENAMKCAEIAELGTSDLNLTGKKAQKVVGWARNICLSEGHVQQKGKLLYLPRESLEKAIARMRSMEMNTNDKMNELKAVAENEYETELISSVVRAKEIGISFDQIGALEDVKHTLKELIIMPLKRPELFKKGNLRKPCKGVLLFGPPGTGKTLLAKAVATEAGANFMNVNSSHINSKWFGDGEKLAKALFALARKLEPTIIFIDEVDSILQARGDASEHEASRRVRNELMAAWDGLQSKDSERILVLATTNRPFDLDDAVIRRLPRRIFIDLPNIENRVQILRVLLGEEDLEKTFDVRELASQTEGFSGSDLKNLCVAAAYQPIREFLEAEKQAKVDGVSEDYLPRKGLEVNLRPLRLDDFFEAKIKVGMSIAYDASSMVQMRQWNEQYGEGGSRTKSVFGFAK